MVGGTMPNPLSAGKVLPSDLEFGERRDEKRLER
jgi:hypothetical protein